MIFVERTPWPGFVAAVLWGTVVLGVYPLLAGWDHDLPSGVRWLVAVGVVVLVGAIHYLLGGLTVKVGEHSLQMHLGSVPLVRRRVPYASILALESVTYHPILEFGGWGVRGFGKRKAWTARGDRAVKLTLTGARELLVGSDHPQRLEERIRAAAGERLGRDRRETTS